MRKTKSKETYYLYWIHRKSHTSLKQGYIGVTYNPDERFSSHRCNMKRGIKSYLYNSMRKYKDIKFTILCIGGMGYICDLEKKLRPKDRMGWNTVSGGEVSYLDHPSEESIIKMARTVSKYSKIEVMNILIDYYVDIFFNPEFFFYEI